MKSLDDIVFKNRNKEYGSYDIRSSHLKRLVISCSIVFGFFVAVSLFLYFRDIFLNDSNHKNDAFTKYVTLQNDQDLLATINDLPLIPAIYSTNQDELPELENSLTNKLKRRDILVKATTREYKPVVKVIDSAMNKMLENMLERHKSILLSNKKSLSDSLKIILEKAPTFPGGYSAVQSFFLKYQRYPQNALLKGVQGNTIVSFVVNTKGVVEDPKIVEGIDPELDREAIRLVSIMPNWQPAYYKGKPISCIMVMPVSFSIK